MLSEQQRATPSPLMEMTFGGINTIVPESHVHRLTCDDPVELFCRASTLRLFLFPVVLPSHKSGASKGFLAQPDTVIAV